MEAPQKIKNRTTLWSSNPISRYTSKQNENRIIKKIPALPCSRSIIHNSQNTETTLMSINGQMDKEDVEYIHKMMWITIQPWERRKFCHLWQHGWNPQGHYTKWSKPNKGKYCMLSLFVIAKQRQILHRGAWMAQLVKGPALDFGSGHDLAVRGFEPRVELHIDSVGPARVSLPPSLSLPHSCFLKINKL